MSGHFNGLADSTAEQISRFIGETVTIFTTSGGESGSGFTGVVLFVNDCFVRLVTCVGAAPNCALGSACDSSSGFFNNGFANNGLGCRKCRGEFNGNRERIGSVVDIPIERIAAFVHNAV